NSHARNITFVPSLPLGTNKNGGRLMFRGTAHTGTGATGGIDFQKTNAAPLALFRDSLITLSVDLTSTFAGTFDSLVSTTFLSVKGTSGATVAAQGDVRTRNGFTAWSKTAGGVDAQLLGFDTGNALIVGQDTSVATTQVRGT